MGFNTTIVVLNDALDYIRDDPDFGKRLSEAISEAVMGERIDVCARSSKGGVFCNAATVIETHHASHDVLVRVGGNRGEVVNIDDLK